MSIEGRLAKAEAGVRTIARARYYARLDEAGHFAHEMLCALGLFVPPAKPIQGSADLWTADLSDTDAEPEAEPGGEQSEIEAVLALPDGEFAAYLARALRDYYREWRHLFGTPGCDRRLTFLLDGLWRRSQPIDTDTEPSRAGAADTHTEGDD